MKEKVIDLTETREVVRERTKRVWEMTRDEYLEHIYGDKFETRSDISTGVDMHKKTHKISVKRALSEGKPVPTKVLRDYPDLQEEKLEMLVCYVCRKERTKEKMQYVGQDKWRCKKCFVGSKSWRKSDIGKKSALREHFELASVMSGKPIIKGGDREKRIKMFVMEDKKKHMWMWFTYPDGQKVDFTSVSPVEFVGYDEVVRKEMSSKLAVALRGITDIWKKETYKDKPNAFIYTFVGRQKKEKEEIKMGVKKEELKQKVEKKKKTGIGALVRQMIKNKNTYEEIEKVVKKEFPESKFNKAHYYWYRKNM